MSNLGVSLKYGPAMQARWDFMYRLRGARRNPNKRHMFLAVAASCLGTMAIKQHPSWRRAVRVLAAEIARNK